MKNLVNKRIKQHEAAQHLGITERRLKQRLRQYIIGAEALLPKPTIAPPNQYNAELKEKLRSSQSLMTMDLQCFESMNFYEKI